MMIYLQTLPWGAYEVQVEFGPFHPVHFPVQAKAQMFDTAIEALRWAAQELNLPYRIGTAHPSSMEIEVGYK